MTTTQPDIRIYADSESTLVGIGRQLYWVTEEYDGYTFAKFGTQGGERYKVYVRAGKAGACNCPHAKYRRVSCKHVAAAQQILDQW